MLESVSRREEKLGKEACTHAEKLLAHDFEISSPVTEFIYFNLY